MDTDGTSVDLETTENAFRTLYLDNNAQRSQAIAVLAEASKSSTSTRQNLGDRIVLERLIGVIDCSLNESLETVEVALKCIGNACIDNNAARQEVTDIGFNWALRCLGNCDVATEILATKALYNICTDCESAQQQCFEMDVHHELIRILSMDLYEQDDRRFPIELIFWMCSCQQGDIASNDALATALLVDSLMLPWHYNWPSGQWEQSIDDYAMLVESCLIYVRMPTVQRAILGQGHFKLVWQLLIDNEAFVRRLPSGDEDVKLLTALSTSLVWCLSDMAAEPEFATVNGLKDDWITENPVKAIEAAIDHSARFVTAACHVLGNLAWSLTKKSGSSTDIEMARLFQQQVQQVLFDFEDAEVLHAAAGLLLQLTRFGADVRQSIAFTDSIQHVLEKLCKHETPQVRQDGVKLLRSLGQDDRDIQLRFAMLAQDVMSSSSGIGNAAIEGDS